MAGKQSTGMEDFMAPIPDDAKRHHEKMKFWSDLIAAAFRSFLMFIGSCYLIGKFLLLYGMEGRGWFESLFMWLLVPCVIALYGLFAVLYFRAFFAIASYNLDAEKQRPMGMMLMVFLSYGGLFVAYGVLAGEFLEVSTFVTNGLVDEVLSPLLGRLP